MQRAAAHQAPVFFRVRPLERQVCLVAIDAADRQSLFVRQLYFEHICHQAVLVA
jgi:hypothetical protein